MDLRQPVARAAGAVLIAAGALAPAAAADRCPASPTLADLKAAFGGPALDAIGAFGYRLTLTQGAASQVVEHRLEPRSGRLMTERGGVRQWWDGAHGWQSAAGQLALLGEAATKRLRDASAHHFLTLLADPATTASAAGPHRLRLAPRGGEAFVATLDPADCRIRRLEFDDGTTGTEADYRDVAGARWPFRFTLRAADGVVTEGAFSDVTVHTAAALPMPSAEPDGARVLPEPRGPVAVLAGGGWLSGAMNDYNLSLDAAGRVLVFASSEAGFAKSRILVATQADGRWSAPVPIAFTDPRYRDSDPWLTPDGQWLYFVSDRPPQGDGPAQPHLDIWRVRRLPTLGTPEHLGALASGGYELGPEVHDGWIYFNSTRRGGPAPMSIWRARVEDAGFGPPEPLPAPFNGARTQGDFTLSPDGRTALFWAAGADNDADLHAVRRTAEGWSAPVRLPAPFNGRGADFTPAFSADGRFVIFASERRFRGGDAPWLDGLANLYVAPRSLVEQALDASAAGTPATAAARR